MNSGYQLMEHLAQITAFKDTRLLELTLLKTLQTLFKPDSLLLVKLNMNNQPLFLLRYDPDANLLKNDDPTQLCNNTQALIIDALNKKYLTAVTPQKNGYISIFPVLNLFDMNCCFILKSANALSADDINLTGDFLAIYRNFCLLIEDVQTDQLTGLLNRKTFEKTFSTSTKNTHANQNQITSVPQRQRSLMVIGWQ